MRKPNYKGIAHDFLAKAQATRHDLCLDFNPTDASEIIGKKISLQAVTDKTDLTARFGICIDKAEPDIGRCLELARKMYFYIPSKRPLWYWMRRINKYKAKILSAEQGNFGYKIYATAYTSAEDLDDWSQINVSDERVEHNVKANLALGLAEVSPHQIQENAEIAVLFGGPSLNEFKDQIYEQAKAGMPVVTANGAYNWALANRIIPAAQIVLDARPFNKRFVEPAQPNCKYLICSQCDPDLVASLPKDQTLLWHPLGEQYTRLIREYFGEKEHVWYPVPGGTTVALRGIPLLMMLGYKKFHVYGLDSCIADTHHAYPQPEDDKKLVMSVDYGGRTFRCYPWMAHQCSDFMKMTRHMIGNLCDMEIYGDGLIAHCIRTLAGENDGSDEMAVLQQREDPASQWWIRPGHPPDADGPVQEHG